MNSCPLCGGSAYLGLITVECGTVGCSNYYPEKEVSEAPKKKPGRYIRDIDLKPGRYISGMDLWDCYPAPSNHPSPCNEIPLGKREMCSLPYPVEEENIPEHLDGETRFTGITPNSVPAHIDMLAACLKPYKWGTVPMKATSEGVHHTWKEAYQLKYARPDSGELRGNFITKARGRKNANRDRYYLGSEVHDTIWKWDITDLSQVYKEDSDE